MHKQGHLISIIACVLILVFANSSSSNAKNIASNDSEYSDLVRMFEEFRILAQPKAAHGVPDFTSAAMKVQEQALKKLQGRLAAMDI